MTFDEQAVCVERTGPVTTVFLHRPADLVLTGRACRLGGPAT